MVFLLSITKAKKKRMKQRRNKMGTSKYIIAFSITLSLILGSSVNSLRAQVITDSLPVLSESEFLVIIRKFHPVLSQAATRVERADAALTIAKGGFDPTLNSSYNRKRFGGDLYYSYYNPEIQIPTWYGVEVYAGLENINGARVNSESSIGQTSYLGVSIPLLKDLVFDKRRAVLQQAKLFKEQTAAERDLEINDLLNEGLTAYWNWVKEFQLWQLLKEAVKLNQDRFRLLRIEVQQGNRAAIDTVEATTQLQQFQLLASDAQLKFWNAGLELSNFLWIENGKPYQLPNTVIPDSKWAAGIEQVNIPLLEDQVKLALLTHPKLRAYNSKMDWLKVEQRLKFQSLLPKMDIKAQVLNKGYNVLDKVNGAFLENNYRFGFDFSIPLRLSEARGGYKEAKLKIMEAGFGLDQTKLEIENKVKSYYNEVFTLKQQIALYESAVLNYQRLLRGEWSRFLSGEGSLFMVNSRESKLIEASLKLQELKTKYYKSLAGVQWASGQLK